MLAKYLMPLASPVAQLVVHLIAVPGDVSSMPAHTYKCTLVEIVHEIISTIIILFLLILEELLSVSNKRKYIYLSHSLLWKN